MANYLVEETGEMERYRELLAEHEDIINKNLPLDNHMMFFWQLVNLELWLRQVDGHA